MRPWEGRKVGLVLASGAARGWAHIGAIAALEEAGVRPALIAGTSIGAFVGAAYASGRIADLGELVREMDQRNVRTFLDMVFPRSGLIDGERLMALMRNRLFLPSFEELPLPFRSVATDLARGVEVVSGSGDLAAAVRASISIPGIFTPVERDGVVLVDGALLNPLPVSVARAMGAQFVIAVDLTRGMLDRNAPDLRPAAVPATLPRAVASGEGQDTWLRRMVEQGRDLFRPRQRVQYRKVRKGAAFPNIFEVLLSSFEVMEVQVVRTRLAIEPADLLIRPRVGGIGLMEFHRGEEAIDEGYRAARQALAGERKRG
jgi:NTE family protein